MGLFGWIRNQFIDVIEWLDTSNNTLVWRFPDNDHEIKNGAKLTVREGQVAIFVNEGQMGDVFPPGLYNLTTQNLPVLTSLKSWKYGFDSPFKAEVYFLNTKQYVDLRWGTMNPITMRDADFGIVRVRAFGLYAIQVAEPKTFFRELVGTDGHVTTNELDSSLKRMLVSSFTTALAQANLPVLDMAGNYERVAAVTQEKMAPEFAGYGLALRKFLIENISLPPEVEKAIDQRTSMGAVGHLGQYAQYQAASSIPVAAANPGGMAGQAVGLAAGLAMGHSMAGSMVDAMQGGGAAAAAPPPAAPQPASPPPLGSAAGLAYHVHRNGQASGPYGIDALRQGVQAGQITRDTPVWRDGMAQWQPAGQLSELASLFAGGATPPPFSG